MIYLLVNGEMGLGTRVCQCRSVSWRIECHNMGDISDLRIVDIRKIPDLNKSENVATVSYRLKNGNLNSKLKNQYACLFSLR